MKRNSYIPIICLWAFPFCFQSLSAQENPQTELPPDSILNIGYARGSLINLSGSVERITESQMNKEQITNPLEAIQGRVAGLTILKSSNGMAALESVRMRGTTSLTSGNDPLIIVDGVLGDLTMLTSIYPADIESFTILKDASETAQYGSRGASGVINIVTKKGVAGKTRVNYSGSFGIAHVYRHLDMLSGAEFRRVAAENNLQILDKGYDTDFQKEIEQVGLQQNHNIAFYGGGEASNYRVSLGYQDRQGVVDNESMKLFTANMNMSQKLLDGFIDCELGLFGSVKKNRTLFDTQKTFYSAATFNPTFPNHKNPETGGWDQITTASQITNPLAWMEVDNNNDASYLSAHARLTFNLMEDLKLVMFGSYTYNDAEDAQYLPTSVWANGQAYRGDRKSESLLGNLMLTYRKQAGAHFFDVLALGELEKNIYKGFYTTVTNFSSNALGYHNLQAGALRPWDGTGSYYEDPHLASFLGRVNYTYDNRYVVTLNARTDASSKFGRNHKWGFFPSASLAWNVTEEAFMKQFRSVDNLKLRVGYGLAGNQGGIDSYTTMALVRPNGVTPVGNAPLVTYESMKNVNPDLKWEVKHTFNAGFDLSMYGNRLLLSVNYYNSKTTDMLYQYNVSVPPFPYSTLLANLGSMRNSGTEVSVGVTPLKTKDMELNINANITFQKNKLLSLSGVYNGEYISASEYTAIAGLNGAGTHGGYNNIVYQIVGQPLGVFYLPHCEGLVSDGEGGYTYQIADLNGGGVNLEDGEDRYVAGQAIPKVLLGSNISFRYKNIDISLQINGAFGHKVYNGTSLSYMNMNSLPDYNVLAEAPKRMIKDQTATDYWLESGNYVNFDYLTVGWTVPLKPRRFLKGIRLAGTVNNLGTISGYSGLTPLVNSSLVDATLGVDDKRTYPLLRTYTVSLSLNF
ncbi:SusC/RagA family TonB-linked outer membrane protein [Bacteroides caecicola]|uniref:SusC/RagA family TonB-linked outer membrane protein n=2 Tax=Bacteroidaceae TaxID=815 RepID=A0ABS2F8A6_9BACE|nr:MULTISPECIES: SusC/RagA family TonB-linked outer membrane protein [Bacteroidaceae]MBD8001223.1 SusC/RagA family TonB-linked outer membrane protein [Phocaeicola faecium]MBM6806009.1 SusC/RagA family TonB-linked outer membrane protein [Bacteroides caecicola]